MSKPRTKPVPFAAGEGKGGAPVPAVAMQAFFNALQAKKFEKAKALAFQSEKKNAIISLLSSLPPLQTSFPNENICCSLLCPSQS